MFNDHSLPGHLRRFLWPTACHACGAEIREGGTPFPRFDLLCARCARRLVPDAGTRILLGGLPLFQAFAPDRVVLDLVKGWKYAGRDAPLRVFIDALRERLRLEEPPPGTVLVPAPLPLPRRLRRGFNQSEVLARGVARGRPELRVGRWLARSPFAGRQAGRRRRERLALAAGEIRLTRRCPGEGRVILVDDICTTGATLRACRDRLEAAGCDVLGALVLARIDGPRSMSTVDSFGGG